MKSYYIFIESYILITLIFLVISCSKGFIYNENTDKGEIERAWLKMPYNKDCELSSIEITDSSLIIEEERILKNCIKKTMSLINTIGDQSIIGALVPNASNVIDHWEHHLHDGVHRHEYKLTFSNRSPVYYNNFDLFYGKAIECDKIKNDIIKIQKDFKELQDTLKKIGALDKTQLIKKRDSVIALKKAEEARKEKEKQIREEKEQQEALMRLKKNPEYSRGYSWGHIDGERDRQNHDFKYTSLDFNSSVKQGYPICDRDAYCAGYKDGYEDGWRNVYNY